MSELPRTLDETLIELNRAVTRAIEDGQTRLQVTIKIPGLDILPVVQSLVTELTAPQAVVFTDPGAAALARRTLGTVDYDLRGISELLRSGLDYNAFILLEPGAVEVEAVEKLASAASGKPLLLINSRLEEVGMVGIGLAGRQLRQRFLSTFKTVYTIQPLDAGAVYRCYPRRWQLWREVEGDYVLAAELDQQPSGEEIDNAFNPKGEGLLAGLRRFLRALGN